MKLQAPLIIRFFLLSYLIFLNADLVTASERELSVFVDTVEKICSGPELSIEGENSKLQGKAYIDASVKGLAKKLVDAGAGGSTEYWKQKFSGLTQDQIYNEIQNRRSCRQNVLKLLLEKAADPVSVKPAIVQQSRVNPVEKKAPSSEITQPLKKTQPPKKTCPAFQREGVCLGVSSSKFRELFSDVNLSFASDSSGIKTEIPGAFEGLTGKYEYNFVNDNLAKIEFHWSQHFEAATVDNTSARTAFEDRCAIRDSLKASLDKRYGNSTSPIIYEGNARNPNCIDCQIYANVSKTYQVKFTSPDGIAVVYHYWKEDFSKITTTVPARESSFGNCFVKLEFSRN